MGKEFDFKRIPEELRELPQWVCWRYEKRTGEKPGKPLINPRTGRKASHSNPNHWADFETAVGACRDDNLDGIGFVFTNDDPYVGLDIDQNYIEKYGRDRVREIIDSLGSYTEWPPSGNGIHVILKGKVPGQSSRKGSIEIYDDKRYFTMTGRRVKGASVEIRRRQKALSELYHSVFVESSSERTKPRSATKKLKTATRPQKATERTQAIENSILARARRARNGAKFKTLFDESDWKGRYKSHSEADIGLCSMLAFWVDKAVGSMDRGLIDRLFRRSALMREKWGRDDYRDETIEKALKQLATCKRGSKKRDAEEEEVEVPVGEPLRDLLQRNLPPVDPIRRGFLNEGDIVFLAGVSGIGKSRLLMQFAIRAAFGQAWLDRRFYEGRKYRVTYLDLDKNVRTSKRDWAKMIRKGVPKNLHVFAPESAQENPYLIDTDEGLEAYERLLEQTKPDILVVDPFGVTFSKADNARGYEAREVLKRFRELMRPYPKLAIILSHHLPKAALKPRNQIDPSDGDIIRWVHQMAGSQAYISATEGSFMLAQEPGSQPADKVKIFGGKGKTFKEWVVTLTDDKDSFPRFNRVGNGNGRVLTFLDTPLKRSIFDKMKKLGNFTPNALRQASDCNSETVRQVINIAKDHGVVQQISHGNYQVVKH